MKNVKESEPTKIDSSTISLSELLYGILGYIASEKDMKTIPHDSVYLGIYKIRKSYPEHFGKMHFIKSGDIQYSEQIEDALSNLGTSGITMLKSKKITYIEFTHDFDLVKEEILKWYNQETLDKIIEIGEKFYSKIKPEVVQYAY